MSLRDNNDRYGRGPVDTGEAGTGDGHTDVGVPDKAGVDVVGTRPGSRE